MNKKSHLHFHDFDLIKLTLASPDKIKDWSCGEVTKPETINYRTQRSEKNGLFDEKIFGPEKDFECYCGKYKGVRYKGIVCEKCGVEVTRSIVRRERMGHIELASPVSHIWFLRSMPSRIGLVFGISTPDLEKVVYFAGYIITKVFEDERQKILKDLDSEFKAKVKNLQSKEAKDELKDRLSTAKQDIDSIRQGVVIDEVKYHNFSIKYGTLFEAHIGAEALYELAKEIDLKKLIETLEKDLEKASSLDADRIKKRLSFVRSMHEAKLRPEWMFLSNIPVIPPAMRPMVPLDGGRYATSDSNDLYRRVINRNNRLKKLQGIHAPDVILRNEKRILQEAVDALIDNSIRHNTNSAALNQAQRRPLKSLADGLKGKRGLLRGNLLGKRVDYSGRSVIVIGPTLKLHQCGLPKHMALELFRPFVIAQLLDQELAFNIRGAGRLIDDGIPEVWAILEDVIKDKYVLLNRAPTLHRLGIQAFQPVLIEGNAIQVHPLVCTAFNADFDGDQMAVHVPLSEEAQLEAKEIMASDKNILKPGSGDPIISAKMLDIILGCYWMTRILDNKKGHDMVFLSTDETITAHQFGSLDYEAKIKVLVPDTPKYAHLEEKVVETCLGRILFNNILPEDFPFINEEVDRKKMAKLVDQLTDKYGFEALPPIMDKIKSFGFESASISGTTWGLNDIKVPEGKDEIIQDAAKQSDKLQEQYDMGLLSENERKVKNTEIWHEAKAKVEELIPDTLEAGGSVYDMVYSGARGSIGNITIMAGLKGLIVNTAGETLEFPILSSSKEGLTPLEYFITTHGSRKGLTDTALNTAKAGYLTRRLFDVSQDVTVSETDCGTSKGILIRKETASGIEVPIAKNIRGRFLATDVLDKNGKVLFKKGHYINKEDSKVIEKAGIEELLVRSPMTCTSRHGVCAKCYGADLGKGHIVDVGETVGTVAAQAIGEPGTQLTMRTFHAGGTASVGGDITQGLPRVEELFEKRKPKNPAVVSHTNGTISDVSSDGKDRTITVLSDADESKSKVKEIEYPVNIHRTILVKKGDTVKKGQLLTDGSADLDELFKFAGKDITEEYIIHEITKPYELQGETVSRKHIELIVRQMFSRCKVVSEGDTALSAGDVVESAVAQEENETAKENGGESAKLKSLIMGITDVALSRKSFLSAASFQHTTRVLISSAIKGNIDELRGLKENVIIGRLIPAGTGFKGSQKQQIIEKLQDQIAAEEAEKEEV